MSSSVPKGWRVSTIGESATNVNKKYHAPGGSNPRYVGLEHISPESRRIQSWGYANDITSTKTAFECGDTLFGKLRPNLRKVSYADFNGICSTDILALRAGNGIAPEFLYRVLSSERVISAAVESSFGNVMPRTSWGHLSSMDYLCPPLPEQQKIAAVLSSVDGVIEKTCAQIDKLKALKAGMMQELLTKGIGHTEFKDSPLGRIPSSWNVRSLGALSSFVTSGSRGWAQYYSSSGAIFIRIGNLTREHINLRFDDTVYVTPPASAEGKRTQVTIGDVLISITADLGVIGVVNESIGEAFVNQHISLVRMNEPALARWVGHFLAFENSQKQFIANNDAGAKAGLNLTAIRKTLVAIPAKDEREKIVASLDSVDQDVSLKRDKLQRLMNLKKALMQDLLTGKVRVKIDQKESAVV